MSNAINSYTQVSDDFERRVTEAREMRSRYLSELVSMAAAHVGVVFSIKDIANKLTHGKFSH